MSVTFQPRPSDIKTNFKSGGGFFFSKLKTLSIIIVPLLLVPKFFRLKFPKGVILQLVRIQ